MGVYGKPESYANNPRQKANVVTKCWWYRYTSYIDAYVNYLPSTFPWPKGWPDETWAVSGTETGGVEASFFASFFRCFL